MTEKVAIILAAGTSSRMNTKLPQDTVIEPFTYIHGQVQIGQGCRIGTFAYLRGGTVLKDDVVLGVFTEIKNSILAEGVRARHHSYIGDATVGKNVNIGAGVVVTQKDINKFGLKGQADVS